ncbi:universal stress protein [Streptomyces toxytricini]|uniref:Universal stress protein n=2 Tax=Streptomyces toxytricini TaxID=67369 RepID=A0ABW8EUD4_STRT5
MESAGQGRGTPVRRGPVLAGVRQGPDAARVVLYAARQAVLHGTDLVLLHALAGSGDPEEARERLAVHAEEVRAGFPGMAVEALVREGDASAELVEGSASCRMVVVGPPGRGLDRLLHRSVAFAVAGGARCPVVVMRDWPARGGPVAVAIGDPDRDRAVLETAAAEAHLRHATLLVLHADLRPQVLPPGLAPPGQQSQEGVLAAERRLLEGEAAVLRRHWPGLAVQVQVPPTAAPAALLPATRDAALLVLGGPRHGHRIRLVSTTADLLRHGGCPVMVVPRPG